MNRKTRLKSRVPNILSKKYKDMNYKGIINWIGMIGLKLIRTNKQTVHFLGTLE
jgi:hypothetical protein